MNAKDWRAFVLTPSLWSEAVWEQAQAEGLAVRRTDVRRAGHKWVLTDAGLDKMNEGK